MSNSISYLSLSFEQPPSKGREAEVSAEMAEVLKNKKLKN